MEENTHEYGSDDWFEHEHRRIDHEHAKTMAFIEGTQKITQTLTQPEKRQQALDSYIETASRMNVTAEQSVEDFDAGIGEAFKTSPGRADQSPQDNLARALSGEREREAGASYQAGAERFAEAIGEAIAGPPILPGVLPEADSVTQRRWAELSKSPAGQHLVELEQQKRREEWDNRSIDQRIADAQTALKYEEEQLKIARKKRSEKLRQDAEKRVIEENQARAEAELNERMNAERRRMGLPVKD